MERLKAKVRRIGGVGEDLREFPLGEEEEEEMAQVQEEEKRVLPLSGLP